ncbi:MAG TPA: 3-isopropylmalate dehydratase large subunit [Chloroflexota bacterium]|jgi:3-isopropylmalate/(R)-2-methylmalate dehydratase large subunit|nr:3-isopropylmalate dehydratase large subunit [Chloroflexota bacterium]
MGMTITEKILAAHAGKDVVRPGEILMVKVDVNLANELSAALAIDEFKKIRGASTILNPKSAIFVPDHFTPNKDISTAKLVQRVREFALEQEAVWFEVGRAGIEHCVLPQNGLVGPGDLIIGGDSHTTTYGALGAFSTGVGSTDVAVAWALGETWLRVPPSMKFIYSGAVRPWVVGKDIILYTIGKITVDGATYKAMEFHGEALKTMPFASRFTMANMSIEAGAKNGIFHVDELTREFLAGVRKTGYTEYQSDADADYDDVIEINVDDIEPQVALPSLPGNTRPISEAPAVRIDQVVIGTCTNGWIEDMRQAADVLRGRKVAPGVRCIIVPGSQLIYKQAVKEGLVEVFAEADCIVSTSTCGPCIGGHMGVLGENEVCVSTTNRNFVGRMGARSAQIYLVNPAVAAASAVAGELTGPESVVGGRPPAPIDRELAAA